MKGGNRVRKMINHESIRNIRLGELLVHAGLVKEADVEGQLAVAQFMGLPLGTLLVREKKVTREILRVAIRLQTLIADGMISLDLSCTALRDIYRNRVTAAEILESLDSYSENVRTCRLGELLVDAGLVTEVELGRALVNSAENRAPLGETLIQIGASTPEVIGAALFAQSNVRARMLDYPSAVAELKTLSIVPRNTFMQAS